MTDGWIDYAMSPVLVELFSYALLSTGAGHNAALAELQKDIEVQKTKAAL